MKITKLEVKDALDTAVVYKILDFDKGRYRFSKTYKNAVMRLTKADIKYGREYMVLKVLKDLAYFHTPRTEREITIMVTMLLLCDYAFDAKYGVV